MIERHHLEILRAIDENGTLTSAADKLCLSQPALSHAIRKLEQQLNLALWHKDGRQLQLTKAGRYLLQQGRDILSRFEATERMMQNFSEGRQGALRIGMECHPCYQWLLRVVQPYLAQWPDVDLDVRQRFQFSGLEALRNHDIDALITPDPVDDARLLFQPVFDYELTLAVHREHPLAKKTVISAQDIASERLITYPVPKDRLDIYTQFLIPAGIQPKAEQQTETTEIMLQLVAAGRGVSAMPGWLLQQYTQSLPLAALRLGETGIKKQIYIGIRREDAGILYVSQFIDLCRQV